MKVERTVGLLSVSLIIVSTIAVYLEIRQKRTKLLTPIVMLMLENKGKKKEGENENV